MRFLHVLFLLLLLSSNCYATELPKGVIIDSIVVVKNLRTMYVFHRGAVLKTYIIALGRQPVGNKICQGDNRTPEGLYFITSKNPNSCCHKNLGISYPNRQDRLRARKLSRSPGGDIKIHGLPNGQGYIGAAHTNTDWTYGCVAVTDEEIDEIFSKVAVGTPVNILP